MTVLATLKDGRIVAKGSLTTVARDTPGLVYTSATITDLRKVEEVLNVNLTAPVQVTPQNVGYGPTAGLDNNVVGLSVYVGMSVGQVSGEAVVLGF